MICLIIWYIHVSPTTSDFCWFQRFLLLIFLELLYLFYLCANNKCLGTILIISDFSLLSSLRYEISSCNSFKRMLPSGETFFSSRSFFKTYIYLITKDFNATSSAFILQVCSWFSHGQNHNHGFDMKYLDDSRIRILTLYL